MLAAVRVPWAFVVRDLRIEASHKTALLMRVVAPIATVFVFFFVQRALHGGGGSSLAPYGGDYFAFALIGLALLGYMSYGMNAVVGSIRAGQAAGALEHMLLGRSSATTILLGSSVPGYLLASVSLATSLVACAVVGTDLTHAAVGVALVALALGTTAFIGLGLLAASLVIVTRRGNPIGFAIRTGSLALAGVLYPVSVLPEGLRWLAQALPLTHVLETMRRSLLLGDGVGELWPDLLALAGIAAVLVPLSLLACRAAIRVARTDGSLTH